MSAGAWSIEMNGTPAAIEVSARFTAASMSHGIAMIAPTPWDRNESTCDAWRCASLSALANFILAPLAATASVIAFCWATRNGSILSNETPMVRSSAPAGAAPAASPSRPPASSARVN